MAKPIDPRIKAAALADLVTGASLAATAKKYNTTVVTLRRWRDEAGLSPVITQTVREQIWASIDVYLLEAIETMRAHLRVGRDEAYLKSHDTAGLAALHTAIAEKVARMVEAEEEAAVGSSAPVDIRRAS